MMDLIRTDEGKVIPFPSINKADGKWFIVDHDEWEVVPCVVIKWGDSGTGEVEGESFYGPFNTKAEAEEWARAVDDTEDSEVFDIDVVVMNLPKRQPSKVAHSVTVEINEPIEQDTFAEIVAGVSDAVTSLVNDESLDFEWDIDTSGPW